MPHAVGTALQGLFYFPIYMIRLGPGAANMSSFEAPLRGRLTSFLEFIFGFLERSRNFLLQILKLFTKFRVLFAKLENLLYQNFLFLQKQILCVQFTKILLCS